MRNLYYPHFEMPNELIDLDIEHQVLIPQKYRRHDNCLWMQQNSIYKNHQKTTDQPSNDKNKRETEREREERKPAD